jgi:U5 small nuclear ribonucleoprotein component
MDDDLYDEFGNFIGEEAEASEEESQHGVDVGNYAYDDEYPEAAAEAPVEDHMDVDGMQSPRSNAPDDCS